MSTRLPSILLGGLLGLAISSTAYAQAPGSDYQGPSATPVTAPPASVVAPATPGFASHWSVAAAIGSLTVAPSSAPDASSDFSIGQLALRYRGDWRHLEIEFALAGGNQTLADGTEGELKVATGTLAARYRFGVASHANWWLLGGLGATTIAPKSATRDQASAAQRGHGVLGIGAEYRWTQFAIQAEARALFLGQTKDEMLAADQTGIQPDHITGGTFTLGGAFYF